MGFSRGRDSGTGVEDEVTGFLFGGGLGGTEEDVTVLDGACRLGVGGWTAVSCASGWMEGKGGGRSFRPSPPGQLVTPHL